MPINVTVTLDSGSFLPMTEKYCEIGYFVCERSCSDIKIFIDGEEPDGLPDPFKLCDAGARSTIEFRHNDINDGTKEGIDVGKSFHRQLLHFKELYENNLGLERELYEQNLAVERERFDCVLMFRSGHFRASMIKKRDFKTHTVLPNGSLLHDKTIEPRTFGPIAHNMIVSFSLAPGESFELARDNKVFWTSKGKTIKERLEIEVAVDNATAVKFYKEALRDSNKTSYLLPNQGDPPPSCPLPPCPRSTS